MLHHANTAAQPAIVHAPTQPPLIALGIVNLDCFQIRCAIEAADRVQLSVHDS